MIAYYLDFILVVVCDLCCKGLYRVCEKQRRFQERKRLSLRLSHFVCLHLSHFIYADL